MWKWQRCAIALAFMAGSTAGIAQLAPAPPMGWNSWDSYGLTIDEPQFRANVDVMARVLKPAGYEYAVIDEGWFLENPRDAARPETLRYRIDGFGRYQPALNRFANATGDSGFQSVADYVHGQGLKFGIHILRGISKKAVAANLPVADSGFHAADVADTSDTCPWNPDNYGVKDTAAGQAWYNSVMLQYARWGVDFLKVDCIAQNPYKGDEIRMIHRAIARAAEATGRAMTLSLSPGPAPLDKAAEVAANAQLWRVSNDVWDRWERPASEDFPQGVKNQFAVLASWVPAVKPGNWPDADMLPVGMLGPVPGYGEPRATRLTDDEQRTMMTLWAIARSPLIVGANLTWLDKKTIRLLTNADVIAMDQRGHDQKMAEEDGDFIAWTSRGEDGRAYLALFNTGDSAVKIEVPLARYGLAAKRYSARDVWERKDMGEIDSARGDIAAHGVLLLELRP